MASLNTLLRLFFSFLCGILFAIAFPKFNLPFFAWLAPGLVLWLAHHRVGRQVLLLGFFSGLGCWFVMFYWLLMIPFHFYGFLAFLGQSSVGATYMGIWCWLCWWLWPPRRRVAGGLKAHWLSMTFGERLVWPVLCATAWVATEMMLCRFVTGFPGYLGASQFHWLELIQICAFTGVYGVSFLMVWLSIACFSVGLGIFAERNQPRKCLLPVLPPLIAIVGVLEYGHQELVGRKEPAGTYKIALVQPAIPQKSIWDPSEKTNRFQKLLQISQAALHQKPDLLVWPETALPEMISRNQFTQEAIVDLLRPYKTWMVFGASDFEHITDVNGRKVTKWFNGAFLINPAGEMVGLYHKRHLVPFGEFMPGARMFPWLARFRAAGAGLTPGDRPGFLHTTEPFANFTALICYEDLFPQEVREGQDQHTDFLLNLTNDGWFGDSAAQWLHLVNALFRTVELHLPLVRCCNNGISCWIDAHGGLHNVYFPGSDNVYQSGFKIIEVPLASSRPDEHPTFYRQYGDVFGWSSVALTAALFLKGFGFGRPQSPPAADQVRRGGKRKSSKPIRS